jgi:hypothetical protein
LLISFFKKIGVKKKPPLKMYCISSSGGQWTPAYFVYFPWPPLEAGLSISTFSVSFIRAKEGFVSHYLHAAYDRFIPDINLSASNINK